MALLNRPLTPAEITKFIDLPMMQAMYPQRWFDGMFDTLRYQEVYYFAKRDEVVLAEPNMFYFTHPESPSDSVWMVPGTEHHRRRF